MSIFSLNLHVLYTLSPQLAALGHLTIYNGKRGFTIAICMWVLTAINHGEYTILETDHYARTFLPSLQN